MRPSQRGLRRTNELTGYTRDILLRSLKRLAGAVYVAAQAWIGMYPVRDTADESRRLPFPSCAAMPPDQIWHTMTGRLQVLVLTSFCFARLWMLESSKAIVTWHRR
jgi:hypothetical protein